MPKHTLCVTNHVGLMAKHWDVTTWHKNTSVCGRILNGYTSWPPHYFCVCRSSINKEVTEWILCNYVFGLNVSVKLVAWKYKRSAHAAAVLDLHLLSNQGQTPVLGRGQDKTEVPLIQQVAHALQRDCWGLTTTVIKHHHPAPAASDGREGRG